MNNIRSRASNKAFAKLHHIQFKIENLKKDLKLKRYGPITKQEVLLCLKSEETELEVWKYITKLVETDG